MRYQSEPDPTIKKALATVADDDRAARYPDRTHFISAGSPEQGEMATRALFAGDPVVIVHADGHETLLRPEHVGGIAALFLVCGCLAFASCVWVLASTELHERTIGG